MKEGRKECRKKEWKEGRSKNGSKKGRKKDKKEPNENRARKEGRNARRKKEARKEGRKIPNENPARKEGRNARRKEGRKEGETKEARKEGRKIRRKERSTPTPSTLIQVIRIILLLIIIIIVRPQYSNYIKRRQMPKALRKVASSIFAPAKTEPIWTLSEPIIKVFAHGGGGCAPPNPPAFCMQAGFQKPRTREKDFANGGAAPPPQPQLFFAPCRLSFKKIAPSTRVSSNTPALFLSCARSLQLSS